ncbi:DUF255 domain-containing protein [Ferruginibacter lapsinanis]|uniref:thioredoxin family protein n=1 Tax=Ferruginibacter lapsinanis TaxID=563172 RepID=UPI001E573511|nr:DUF255 domain-containing protein [Ferruginibacter lapsinanis]UEG50070.1 DUF255 domain-containing protein [Ferruginibacter lapsinanis]
MQKVINFLAVTTFFVVAVSFIAPKKAKVQWMSVEEMQEAYIKTPKPILVDLYTDWCGWCKVMDRETYQNEAVANYINQNYYPVKLNAEFKKPIQWDGKIYSYNSRYRANDLAVYLSQGNMSYPTTVLLPSINAQPAPLPGFFKPGELESPLKYFGDGGYKTKTFPEFLKTFSKTW